MHTIKVNEGLKPFKVSKTPNLTDEAGKSEKNWARWLFEQVLTKNRWCILIDNETIVQCGLHQLSGQQYYIVISRRDVKKVFKYHRVTKIVKCISYGRLYALVANSHQVSRSQAPLTSKTAFKNDYCLYTRATMFHLSYVQN